MTNEYKIIKISKEFEEIINYIRAKHLMENDGDPPTIPSITKVIAQQINKEELWKNEFIKR